MKTAVGICEVVNFESSHEFFDFVRASQQCGDHHHCPQFRGYPTAQFQSRQRPRIQPVGNNSIDERDRQVRGGNYSEKRHEHEACHGNTSVAVMQQRKRENRCRHNPARAQIARRCRTHIKPKKTAGPGQSEAQLTLEVLAPSRNEAVAGILLAFLLQRPSASGFYACALHLLHYAAGDFDFGVA